MTKTSYPTYWTPTNATPNNMIRVDHPLYVAFLRHMVQTQDWDINALLYCISCPWRWQDEFCLFIAAHKDHATRIPTLAEMHEWERVQREVDEAEHGTLCPTCHGTGESEGGSMVCLTCKGTGGAY